MNWSNLISKLIDSGHSQVEIGQRIGRSQAWVSAVYAGKYKDVSWSDGQALIKLAGESVETRAA